MNVNTRQLQAFIAIARLGSFTRAAEEIFVTQAGLSLMLKDFEAQVGARLFDRTTRSVSLTSAGQALLPTVRGMLADWESAMFSIDQFSAVAGQRLELAATPLIASSVLPDWLHEFRRVQPSVQVNVSDLDRRQILQGIESGEIDLGLGAFFKPAAGIERRLLATFQMVRICSMAGYETTSRQRGRRSGLGQKARWAEFSGERLLTLPADNPIQKLVNDQLGSVHAAPVLGGGLQNIQTIIGMVEAGHGVAALPGFVVSACERYNVTIEPLIDPVVPIEYFAVTKKGRQKTELATHTMENIETYFQRLSQIGAH
ncbi:LysR family transcriptional regulator [Pseudomonas alliivorans]|nr:LysR family transcriptional regulator [Pseudomonas alliivorans]MEE4791497.1 LysR family transcriptional regulator [Pseudomonas alliivorans]MEE4797648.1 LysR family transcriptional regulator [Pseudomonas alliivorans]MEE4807524.1 LysR family transcriptional regulator [Pseudomonas alliivorans]MEE4822951.1 LysR family transcriptional regulator [Pseudomonas alliivorans]